VAVPAGIASAGPVGVRSTGSGEGRRGLAGTARGCHRSSRAGRRLGCSRMVAGAWDRHLGREEGRREGDLVRMAWTW
jgi:hypothetical protein